MKELKNYYTDTFAVSRLKNRRLKLRRTNRNNTQFTIENIDGDITPHTLNVPIRNCGTVTVINFSDEAVFELCELFHAYVQNILSKQKGETNNG